MTLDVRTAYVPDPLTTPEAWDYVVIGGAITPGVAEVSGCDIEYKIDEPDPKGASGSDVVINGRKNATIKVALTLWRPEQFHTWELFKQTLLVPEGAAAQTPGSTAAAATAKAPSAFDIEHPWCSAAGITSVVVEKLGQPERQEDRSYKIEILLRQYSKPKPAGGKPSGSVAGVPPTAGGNRYAGAGGFSGPVDPTTDPTQFASVPDAEGNWHQTDPAHSAEGEAVQGEADAYAEDP